MIRGYSDHAANERTFLAWVRTAIAIMAFGFLVEKFDLFLEVAAPSLVGRAVSLPGQRFGNWGGLALIVLGTAINRCDPFSAHREEHRRRRATPGPRIAD